MVFLITRFLKKGSMVEDDVTIHNPTNSILNVTSNKPSGIGYSNVPTITIKYVNLSRNIILIFHRNGTYTVVPPHLNRDYQDTLLILKSEYNYTQGGGIFVNNSNSDDFLTVVKNELSKSNNQIIEYEEKIDLIPLYTSIEGAYSSNSDILICMEHHCKNELPAHPYCIYGDIRKIIYGGYEGHTNINFKLIDNEGHISYFYYIINGIINRLKSTKSNNLKSGFYISGLNKLNERGNSIEYFTLEDSLNCKASIPIFKSPEDASLYLNSTNNSKKHEILLSQMKAANLEKELAIKERDIIANEERRKTIEVSAKAEQDLLAEKAKYDKELSIIKDNFEKEMMKLKEMNARGTIESKSNLEELKIIGAFITVGAIALKVLG